MKNTLLSKQLPGFPSILILIWVFAALIVMPFGDFPLNDDFSFGRTVHNLTEQNQLLFDEWLSMTLITQVAWGALFSEIFGFSFTTLRFSTLTIAPLGILAFYQICREFKLSKSVSFFSTLVIAFNPLFFNLSYTFMTDVPFISVSILCILFVIKFIRYNRSSCYWLFILFAILSIFIRQLGLMLPAAFAFTWLFHKKINLRNLIFGFFPLFISAVLFITYQYWFENTQGTPETFGTFSKLFKRIGHDNFLSECVNRIGLLLIYVGLFLMPLHILFFRKIGKPKHIVIGIVVLILALFAMIPIHSRFPWGNIFYNLGLGPKLLKDGYFFVNVTPTLSLSTINLLAWIGIAGGVLFLLNIIGRFKIKNSGWDKTATIRLFIFTNIIIYGGFLMLDVYFFDRYFIPIIFLSGIFLLSLMHKDSFHNMKWYFSFIVTLPIIVFSISATHDYLSWNRARWQALDYLTEEKNIPPQKIDGGFEFNGWYKTAENRNEVGPKSWWWVKEDDYVVSFGGLGGYTKANAFPFKTFLPPATDTIYILEKNK